MTSTVLAFGTYNLRKHPRVGIILDGLRDNGMHVEEINKPLLLTTAQRVDILKHPWKLFGFAWTILKSWGALSHRAKSWMKVHGKPRAVIVGYMGHFDVLLARHIIKDVPIILDHLIFAGDTAVDRGVKGLKVTMLRHLDKWAVNAADLVIVDTQEHRQMLPAGVESMVVPVGASAEWYEVRKAGNERNHDVIFYGLYTPLQGAPVIAQALRILAEDGITPHVTMVGKGQDYPQVVKICEGLDNVDFVEWVEPERLPRVVASHKIALGIFSTTAKGMHVVPNKVYQSMAAGCAVITSGTAPQRRMLQDSVIFVRPGDPHDLANAISSMLASEEILHEWQRAASEKSDDFTGEILSRPIVNWINAHSAR